MFIRVDAQVCWDLRSELGAWCVDGLLRFMGSGLQFKAQGLGFMCIDGQARWDLGLKLSV